MKPALGVRPRRFILLPVNILGVESLKLHDVMAVQNHVQLHLPCPWRQRVAKASSSLSNRAGQILLKPPASVTVSQDGGYQSIHITQRIDPRASKLVVELLLSRGHLQYCPEYDCPANKCQRTFVQTIVQQLSREQHPEDYGQLHSYSMSPYFYKKTYRMTPHAFL